MADLHWFQICASFITGGAFGNLIKIGYDRWSSKHQPIAYAVSVDSIFSSSSHPGALSAIAQVTHDRHTFQFTDLSLVRIDVINNGNRDFDSFNFGITLVRGHTALLTVNSSADRHHVIQEAQPVASPNQPRSTLDFECRPFNRNDRYSVRLYVQAASSLEVADILISTAAPVRFLKKDASDASMRRLEKLQYFIWGVCFALAMCVGFSFLLLARANAQMGAMAKEMETIYEQQEATLKQAQKQLEETKRNLPP